MPTALVLSAGGLWAAWEVGVWKVLRETLQPDMIVGASAGAWNGWCIAGGCTLEELEQNWLDPSTAKLLQFGLHRSGIFRDEALVRKAHEMFERFRPRIPCGLTVVELPGLQSRLVRGGEITWQHLAATCAIPFGFPPVKIDGKLYVDGGFRGGLPVWAAAEMGATRAVGLNVLTGPWFELLRKVLWTRTATPKLEVITIEPSVPLGSIRDALVWSPGNIKRWIELGEQDGMRAATSITM